MPQHRWYQHHVSRLALMLALMCLAVAIHSLSHIHALRKLNPRFAQAIHGLSAQSAIHGLRKTIHGWSRSTVCAEQIYLFVCVSSKNTAVCCLTARKSPRNSSLPLGLAIYILERCLESRTSLLSSAMAMGF